VPAPPLLTFNLIQRYTRARMGAGVARLVAADARLNELSARRFLARAGVVPELDRLALDAGVDPARVAANLLALIAEGDTGKLLEALRSGAITR
jgi:hypothetical protein